MANSTTVDLRWKTKEESPQYRRHAFFPFRDQTCLGFVDTLYSGNRFAKASGALLLVHPEWHFSADLLFVIFSPKKKDVIRIDHGRPSRRRRQLQLAHVAHLA